MALTVQGLRRAASSVLPAVSRDPNAEVALRCVLVEAGDRSLRLVATDRHRLAIAEAHVTAGEDHFRVLVRGAELSGIDDRALDVRVGPEGLELRSDASTRFVPIVDAEFPQYERLLGAVRKRATVIVPGPLLVDAIEAAVGPGALRMQLTRGSLQLGDEPRVALDAPYDGPDVAVALDADYAHDAAVAVGGGDVAVEIVDAKSPVAFRRVGEYECLVLVMPVRIASPRR